MVLPFPDGALKGGIFFLSGRLRASFGTLFSFIFYFTILSKVWSSRCAVQRYAVLLVAVYCVQVVWKALQFVVGAFCSLPVGCWHSSLFGSGLRFVVDLKL